MSVKGDSILSKGRSDDARLLRGFSSGSKAGFAAFYERFSAVLFSTTYRILRDRQAAEDAMQEAFVEMWKRASEFDASRGTLFSWVVMIARKEALHRLRASDEFTPARETEGMRSLWDGTLQANEAAAHDLQEQRRVCAAFAFLTRGEQEALELCFFDGLSTSEVSRKLGIEPGKLGATVRRGLFGFLHALSRGTEAVRDNQRRQGPPLFEAAIGAP